MGLENSQRYVTDEERRDFLKALGVAGGVAAGGATLDDLGEAVNAPATGELAALGQAIQSDIKGAIDANLIAAQQTELASAAASLSTVVEKGVPEDEPYEEFANVAAAGRPIYDHLIEVGFFESTTTHIGEFTPDYLEKSVQMFVGSETLAAPLTDMEMTGEEGVDLLSAVVANAEDLNHHFWVATEKIPRGKHLSDAVPPMTQGAAGGALLWLEDLDTHLHQKRILITDDIIADTVWHGQSMAAGFHLMSEGAKVIAEESGALSDSELSALLSVGFAVQAIASGLLPQDVYWITDEMRADRGKTFTLETITE